MYKRPADATFKIGTNTGMDICLYQESNRLGPPDTIKTLDAHPAHRCARNLAFCPYPTGRRARNFSEQTSSIGQRQAPQSYGARPARVKDSRRGHTATRRSSTINRQWVRRMVSVQIRRTRACWINTRVIRCDRKLNACERGHCGTRTVRCTHMPKDRCFKRGSC